MSRNALMAVAAVIVVAGVAVVAIGPTRFFPSPRPLTTTTEHLSSLSESGAAPATPVTTGPAQVANRTAAVPGQPQQLRRDLPASEADAVSVTTRAKVEQSGASVPQTASQLYASDEEAAPYWQPPRSADERYGDFKTNPVKLVSEEPVSTFSIDVDTASYANVRRFLTDGTLPPMDAVRTEELINYFPYAYPLPESKDEPFRADIAVFDSPWDNGSQIVRIGLQGYDIPKTTRPPANLVFLVDTSGSMQEPDKLPLVKQSLRLLTEQMQATDSIAIVAYAGTAGVVLEPTKGSERLKILSAIDAFAAGGSTAGAEGIRQAYTLAEANFQKNAINRVILATDGDFNKLPGATESRLIQEPIQASARTTFEAAPADARFATAVAAFGQLLRKDASVGTMTLADVQRIAAAARGEDAFGYRSEFLRLVQVAQSAGALESLN